MSVREYTHTYTQNINTHTRSFLTLSVREIYAVSQKNLWKAALLWWAHQLRNCFWKKKRKKKNLIRKIYFNLRQECMIYSICLFEWNNHFEAWRSPATDKAELHLVQRLYSVCLSVFKSILLTMFSFSLEGVSDGNGCIIYSFVCFSLLIDCLLP